MTPEDKFNQKIVKEQNNKIKYFLYDRKSSESED